MCSCYLLLLVSFLISIIIYFDNICQRVLRGIHCYTIFLNLLLSLFIREIKFIIFIFNKPELKEIFIWYLIKTNVSYKFHSIMISNFNILYFSILEHLQKFCYSLFFFFLRGCCYNFFWPIFILFIIWNIYFLKMKNYKNWGIPIHDQS